MSRILSQTLYVSGLWPRPHGDTLSEVAAGLHFRRMRNPNRTAVRGRRRISRRRILGAGLGSALALAACGESTTEVPPVLPTATGGAAHRAPGAAGPGTAALVGVALSA